MASDYAVDKLGLRNLWLLGRVDAYVLVHLVRAAKCFIVATGGALERLQSVTTVHFAQSSAFSAEPRPLCLAEHGAQQAEDFGNAASNDPRAGAPSFIRMNHARHI